MTSAVTNTAEVHILQYTFEWNMCKPPHAEATQMYLGARLGCTQKVEMQKVHYEHIHQQND